MPVGDGPVICDSHPLLPAAWLGSLAEPMGLFRASNQAQAPIGAAAANLRTAACTDAAINYPRSRWGAAPEGRRQPLQPRTEPGTGDSSSLAA